MRHCWRGGSTARGSLAWRYEYQGPAPTRKVGSCSAVRIELGALRQREVVSNVHKRDACAARNAPAASNEEKRNHMVDAHDDEV